MKTTPLYILISIILIAIFPPLVSSQEYNTWELPEGAIARLGKGEITGNVAFSPDGNRLAVAGSIGIWIYDVRPDKETELELITGHTLDVTTLAYSPDGSILASGSRDGSIRLWDTITGKQIILYKGEWEEVITLVISTDGKMLASGHHHWFNNAHQVRLWNLQTKELITTIDDHTSNISSLAFSPDGKTLATGSRDKTVRIWDTQTGEHKSTLVDHKMPISTVVYSPDGKTLTTVSPRDTVLQWDTETGTYDTSLFKRIGQIHSLTFSPDGSTIAIDQINYVKLINSETGKLETVFRCKCK